ncbi:NAD(P)-binding domain-containing protein [Macrococcus bovicus]|uniref:Pyridine nucleotide-disulfide oxidoreductase n=1 Tax=Macrococcus bovicus TaxID=69968 RepID=A0A4R6BY02_9STAP|nr:NAD(P)-binding domain-containing protein [Macrococcus bovicus]TDM13423.1 pyridine nucleotide-disulfide oxidoreductase [Macrococcus bovicus]
MNIIIIGGGIHGITIALRLLQDHIITKESLQIIEPGPYTQQWRQITDNIAMDYLRSPVVHHVHPNPYDLKQFAKINEYTQAFSGYYQRPQLEMFNDHIQHAIKENSLEDCHVYDKAVTLTQENQIWTVTGENGVYQASHLILATGLNHIHHIPDFMSAVSPERYQHIFDYHTPLADADVVIGGGITACHAVRKLSAYKPVTLIMRHDIRCHELDSEPGWLGPKNMKRFHETDSFAARREMIKEARHRGSMPMHLKQSLKYLEAQGKVNIMKGHIEKVDNQIITLTDGRTIPYHHIALATGCDSHLCRDPLYHQLIQTYQPPTADCGFPVVNQDLEWFDHLYVSGPLAELELGPVARNIIGGRKAAERIATALKQVHADAF